MKSNAVIFGVIGLYFFVVGVLYTVWHWLTHGYLEWAGTIALFLAAGLGWLISSYLALSLRKQGGVLVEDRIDSDIDDGDPEVGEFSPWSWWPMVLAFAIALVILGLCIGNMFWLSFLAAPLVLVGVIGWIYEYYRGHFAR